MKFSIFLFILGAAALCTMPAGAAQVYTWTDSKGVTHISENPPPKGGKIDAVIEYAPRTADEDRQSQEQRRQFIEDSNTQAEINQAVSRAKTTRRQADDARAKADRAQAEADAAFQRSEQFKMKVSNTIRRWQVNKSTRKKLEAEAAAAQQAAQKASQEADRLEKLALEADNTAEEFINRQKEPASANSDDSRGAVGN